MKGLEIKFYQKMILKNPGIAKKMIPKNPGIAQKGTQKSGSNPQKSTQNNGTSPYRDICKLPPPPQVWNTSFSTAKWSQVTGNLLRVT